MGPQQAMPAEQDIRRIGRDFLLNFCFTKWNEWEEGEWCTVVFFWLCMFLSGAAYTDLTRRKVRNWWVLAAVFVGVILRGTAFLPGAAAALAVGFWLFRLRMMGAGDGKVMMVIAGYLGLRDGSRAIAAGFLVGAVWSLCRLWHDGSFRARLGFFFAYFVRVFQEKEFIKYDELSGGDSRHRIPLAACLAAGAGLYLLGLRLTG